MKKLFFASFAPLRETLFYLPQRRKARKGEFIEMEVAQVVKKVVKEFGTRDVFEIAVKSGVEIVYESWYPTTIGEFDRRKKIISVNRRALEESKNAEELERIIIAHELGHFFARESNLAKETEEKFAREFAQILITQHLEET